MNIGLGKMLGLLVPAQGSTETQKVESQAKQNGLQSVRDSVAKVDREKRAAQNISARLTTMALPKKAAAVGKKKGA